MKDGRDELFASSAEPKVVDVFEEIMAWVQANPQFRAAAKAEFAQSADGWLAAYATVHGAILVTHEQYSPDRRRRVPLGNVCHRFNLDTQDTFGMLRALHVRFEWRKS